MFSIHRCAALVACSVALCAWSQPIESVRKAAAAQKAPLLETLKELTAIESGSRDLEGLDKIANVIAARLKSLGGEVELLPAADITKLEDTPPQIGKAVKATFRGKGTKKILLIAQGQMHDAALTRRHWSKLIRSSALAHPASRYVRSHVEED